MAKKAKRRGRPPGSKNKNPGKSVAMMDIAQLRSHIDGLHALLSKKLNEQRAYLEGQLSRLGGFVSKKTSTAYKAPGLDGRKRRRAKAAPKYRSKKNKNLKWSGRGMTPVWLRDEMKGTKLKKDDFLIK